MVEKTLIMRTAELEATTEAMASVLGSLSTRIIREQQKSAPNERLIDSLREQMIEVKNDRKLLNPIDVESVEKLLNKYGKIVRNRNSDLDGPGA